MSKRPPKEIVLRFLKTGERLLMDDGYMIGLGTNSIHDSQEVPVIVAEKTSNGFKEEIGLYLEPEIFEQWCNNLSEDELFRLSAITALQSSIK